MRETNDRVTDRVGHFDIVVKMIKMLKEKGYRVQTNTTVFRETTGQELEDMVKYLTSLGVDGMLLSPGYHYQVLQNDEEYLRKEEMPAKFFKVRDMANDYKIINTPIYLDYLVGKRDMQCSPWTTVTRNPQGWKGPCYLITNGHYKTVRTRCMRRPIGNTIEPSRISAAAIASCIRDSRGPWRSTSAKI